MTLGPSGPRPGHWHDHPVAFDVGCTFIIDVVLIINQHYTPPLQYCFNNNNDQVTMSDDCNLQFIFTIVAAAATAAAAVDVVVRKVNLPYPNCIFCD